VLRFSGRWNGNFNPERMRWSHFSENARVHGTSQLPCLSVFMIVPKILWYPFTLNRLPCYLLQYIIPSHFRFSIWRYFFIYGLYKLYQALQQADPPSKESYRLCIDSRNWKSGQGPTKDCRAIIIIIIIIIIISISIVDYITSNCRTRSE
jgi:hypothetical protein